MEKEVQDLLERRRIIDTINELFVGTDERDWPRVRECFADEVQFDMTSLAGGEPSTLTPQQITDAWEEGLRPLDAVHHQAGNYRVRVSGVTAEAFCYAIASHYLANPSGENTRTFVGSYDFTLAKHHGRWRVTRFKFNLKYVTGNLDLTD